MGHFPEQITFDHKPCMKPENGSGKVWAKSGPGRGSTSQSLSHPETVRNLIFCAAFPYLLCGPLGSSLLFSWGTAFQDPEGAGYCREKVTYYCLIKPDS